MTIHKYRANSLKAAIDKARDELGPDAKVIHVRQLDKYAVPGMKSPDSDGDAIEIIAAVDGEEDAGSPAVSGANQEIQPPSGYIPAPTPQHVLEKAASTYDETFLRNLEKQIPEEDAAADSQTPNTHVRRNTRQFIPAEAAQRSAHNARNKDHVLQALHKCCSKNQVNPDVTYKLLSLLDDGQNSAATGIGSDGIAHPVTPRDYMSRFIGEQVNTSGGLDASTKTAILIGPTGVGKTTTLAKLAAQYHFQQRKSVGLITIDAYRIAAINQLQTYAQIMSIPLKVALTPKELKKCIDEYDNMDVILVDTPGRSPFSVDALSVLREFLEAAQPADTHLLIAMSTKEDDAYAAADNFAPQYVRQVIFTKLDETSAFGPILNIPAKIGKPVSYLTTGQNVPDDIEIAQVDRMANLFLNAKYSVMDTGC